MSRSYKKTFVCTAGKTSSVKRVANRAVRRAAKLPSGSHYKKVYESWDICDYKYMASSEYIQELKETDPQEYHRTIGK